MAACDAYLQQYPKGLYELTVKELKEKLEKDTFANSAKVAFDKLKSQPSEQGCYDFLRSFPGSAEDKTVVSILDGLQREERQFKELKKIADD